MWAGSELRGERGATGEQRVQAPLASTDTGRVFRQKCRRLTAARPPPTSVSSVKFKHGRPRRSGKWKLVRHDKNASSVVEWEQDGVKDSSTALLGSCTRGWRRRARSRCNYFLFSDPEGEVDCLTGCSSRPCPSAHVCVRESVRITFCSDDLIHGKCRNCLTMVFPTDVAQSPYVSLKFTKDVHL